MKEIIGKYRVVVRYHPSNMKPRAVIGQLGLLGLWLGLGLGLL